MRGGVRVSRRCGETRVAAAGGALAAAVGVTVVGGVVGAGLGGLLLRAVARHHLDSMHSVLSRGSTLLWVTARNPAAEQLALKVLGRCGGTSVHAHVAEHA